MSELERTAQQALRVLEDARLFSYSLKHAECNEMIARLQSALNRQSTHGEGCWSWGPAHYECACRELAKAKGWGK